MKKFEETFFLFILCGFSGIFFEFIQKCFSENYYCVGFQSIWTHISWISRKFQYIAHGFSKDFFFSINKGLPLNICPSVAKQDDFFSTGPNVPKI